MAKVDKSETMTVEQALDWLERALYGKAYYNKIDVVDWSDVVDALNVVRERLKGGGK